MKKIIWNLGAKMKTLKPDKIEEIKKVENCPYCGRDPKNIKEDELKLAKEQVLYQLWGKKNTLRGLVREREFYKEQLSTGIDILDKDQGYNKTIPDYMIINGIEKKELEIEQVKGQLRLLGVENEEIKNIINLVESEKRLRGP